MGLPHRHRQHLPRPIMAASARSRGGYRVLFADQICRRPFGSGCGQYCWRQEVDGSGTRAAQHDGRDRRPQHRMDAAALNASPFHADQIEACQARTVAQCHAEWN